MRIACVGSRFECQADMHRLLRERGHDLRSFTNACEALEAIRSESAIDMLITYAHAKPISGLEVCWEARLLAGEDRVLYILFVAPADGHATKIEALDSGADETMDAVFSPEELHAKLRVAERVTCLQRDLVREASTDYLSGADNRRAFFRRLMAACDDGSRGNALSVIYLDVDRFKAINDRYGHDVGDKALRAIATAARELDLPVGRLGGDEFCILLKDCNVSRALEVASSLKRQICNARILAPEGIVGITCSLGVSEFQAGDSADDLLKRADLALYAAKDRGGNCVATTPKNSWMNRRPRLGVSLVRLLSRPSPEIRDRRKQQPASDALIARVCAVIDLLIASGLDEEMAREAMAQRLSLAEIPPPRGQKVRSSWRNCLREQREILRTGEAPKDSIEEYESVVAAIDAIAPHERVRWVLENEIWDRRRTRPGAPRRTLIPTTVSELVPGDRKMRPEAHTRAFEGQIASK